MVPSFFVDIIYKDSYVMTDYMTNYKTNGFGKEDKEVFL